MTHSLAKVYLIEQAGTQFLCRAKNIKILNIKTNHRHEVECHIKGDLGDTYLFDLALYNLSYF